MVLKTQNLQQLEKKKKNQKQPMGSSQKKNKMGVGKEDRISELPDSLLHHILSFVPTRCVVSTSILSTRWRYLWTSIPVLDFLYWRSPTTKDVSLENERFMNFMDKVVSFHDDRPYIQKFHLHCDESFEIHESRITAWISNVTKHKVEEFYISIDEDFSYLVPSCLFTCESLTILKLDIELKIPESISLPRLKILWLEGLTLTDKDLTQHLFSNCPVLEELSLKYCSWEMDAVRIMVPTLKRLYIFGPILDYLSDFDNTTELEIYAPCLLFLKISNGVANDYVLHSFPLLVDADIDLNHFEDLLKTEEETGYVTSKLLRGISNVKLLRLSSKTFKALSFADDILSNFPTFHNLINLEVSSRFPCSMGRTFLDFLHVSPNLESLFFAKGFDECLPNDDADGWTLNLVVPKCMLLHLKSVEFGLFNAQPGALKVIKLILKNAAVLQRMTIMSSSNISKDLKIEVMEQLLMFPRGSSSCVVKFS